MSKDTAHILATKYLVNYRFADSTCSGYLNERNVITFNPDDPLSTNVELGWQFEIRDTMIHPLSIKDATSDEIAEQFLFGARVFAEHYYTTGDTSRKIKSSYFFKDLEAIGDRQIRGNLDGHTVWIEGLHCLEDFNFPVHGVVTYANNIATLKSRQCEGFSFNTDSTFFQRMLKPFFFPEKRTWFPK